MRKFIIFLFLFTLNCSSNKVSNNHGFISLQTKFEKITVNKTNKNDILNIIGPPSSVSSFDNNKWFYIQRMKTNQSICEQYNRFTIVRWIKRCFWVFGGENGLRLSATNLYPKC